MPGPGILFVVATPIGNLSDISRRALDTLAAADVIAAEDTRNTLKLLHHFEIRTPLLSCHQHNEGWRVQEILERLGEGQTVALVSDAGTPCISDPGGVVVAAARSGGFTVTAVPGPSAVISALSVSGLDTTAFSFYGFLPRERRKRLEALAQIEADSTPTAVLYEAPNRTPDTLAELNERFPNAQVSVGNDLTKLHERWYTGAIAEVLRELCENPKADKGEYVLVIQKNRHEAKEPEDEQSFCLEAMLVQAMAAECLSLKDAVKSVHARGGCRKNQLYEASLRLKAMFDMNTR